MEVSISIEPYLNGPRSALTAYLSAIVALRDKLPISVHYDCFEYRPEIIDLLGGYADKIPVHLHSMLPQIDTAIKEIIKYPFASVSVHCDNPHIVFVMNITNTISCGRGVVFELPVTNIADYANIIKQCTHATVMTVVAGASGRPFHGSAMEKTHKIRAINPNIKITIDGGVNLDTIKTVSQYPVDTVVVGSYAKKCYENGELLDGLKKLIL